ncbi:hypothetical protein ACSVDE_04485 [Pseudalkalibacillus sp. Hm43]|uniref:hypothetical protein n=1 Tax=Pseudalkalibacillus sp. Hm43 TaxID=3450742 RepID=UPI003F443056
MYRVFFNRKELCRLTIDELQALKLIAIFWGLDWDDSSNELTSRLTNLHVRIIGLSPKEFKRLSQLLAHSEANVTPKFQQGIKTLSTFRDTSDSNPFIKLEGNHSVYHFPKPKDHFSTPKDWVYKQLVPETLHTDTKVYWNPEKCDDISEWLTYLILGDSHGESLELLGDIPTGTYETLLRKVLTPINPALSSYQLKTSWPEKPNFNGPDSKDAEPIDPFKYNKDHKPTKFDPFKNQSKKKETKVINPFFRK